MPADLRSRVLRYFLALTCCCGRFRVKWAMSEQALLASSGRFSPTRPTDSSCEQHHDILARQSRAPPSMAFPITTTATASITRPTEHAPAQNTPLAQDYSLGERGSTPNLGLALDVEPGHRLVLRTARR